MRVERSVVLAVMILSTLATPSIASAGLTWTGKGDQQSWDDKKNWSPEGVPQEDDDVTIGVPRSPGLVKLNGNRKDRKSVV